MIFLFPRWDMLIPCRVVPRIFGNPQWITWITWIADDEKLISYISGVLRVASCPEGRCELYWFGVPWRKWQIYLLKNTRGCFFERISQPEFCQEDVLAECFFVYLYLIYLSLDFVFNVVVYLFFINCGLPRIRFTVGTSAVPFYEGSTVTVFWQDPICIYIHVYAYSWYVSILDIICFMKYTMEPIDDPWLWFVGHCLKGFLLVRKNQRASRYKKDCTS